MDRISELPEVVVQHILSFLPTKQVVQSTLLSTTWKHVWSTFPILRFDDTYLTLRSSESNKKRKHDFVENTLRSHRRKRLRINSFTLNVPCWVEDKSMSCVDSWIGFVVECDVQELILEFRWSEYKKDYHRFRLPHTLLVAKSLTVLTLCRCNLETTCGYGDINLPSLKKLSFTVVYANDQIIQNLVDGCPLIEYMRFSCCPGITTIKLSAGVSKLMAIEVACFDDLQRLNFEASNLHSLSISRKSELELILCKNLKQLMLFYVSITDKWLNDYLSRLQHLENLQIAYCSMLVRIKIRGHHLKSLQLRGNSTVEVKIDAPKLSKFSYYGDCATSLSLNPLALSEAIYDLTNNLNSPTYNPNRPTDVEKIEFLSKLSNSKLLILKINSAKDVIIPKELRKTISSPSYNVKHLRLSISQSFTTRDEIGELVDSLLWISPLPDILLMECSSKLEHYFDRISIKFSYEKPNCKGENPSCCKFLPFPCWRHCLKTVKVHSLKGNADREILYKYFENAKTLEDFQFHVDGIA